MDMPSIMTHVSIGTNDFDKALAIYDKVMPTIGAEKKMSIPGAVAYGKMFPECWVQQPIGRNSTVSNGTHVGLFAADKEQVDAFDGHKIGAAFMDMAAHGLG